MQTYNTQSTSADKTQYIEPKRLSKAGQWMRDNPGGIFIKADKQVAKK